MRQVGEVGIVLERDVPGMNFEEPLRKKLDMMRTGGLKVFW